MIFVEEISHCPVVFVFDADKNFSVSVACGTELDELVDVRRVFGLQLFERFGFHVNQPFSKP